MDDILLVCCFQGIGYLDGILQGLLQGQCAFRQPCLQRLPHQVLHNQVVDAVLLPDVMQGADVGVVEVGDGPCFAFKAFPQLGSL